LITHHGPIDLLSLCFKEYNRLRENIIEILFSNKIHYKNSTVKYLLFIFIIILFIKFQYSFSTFVCDKNGMKFEININKSPGLADVHIIKFKKIDGNGSVYKEICKTILSNVNA
jgi:hypothetical protein